MQKLEALRNTRKQRGLITRPGKTTTTIQTTGGSRNGFGKQSRSAAASIQRRKK